jgi:hypothetical protein
MVSVIYKVIAVRWENIIKMNSKSIGWGIVA